MKSEPSSTADFEKSLSELPLERYLLRLYVTGMTPRSAQALATIKGVCEEKLHGQYELEVIDIYQHPELASEKQILAAPTLVRELPAPLRRLIGDLSDRERVLHGLNLRTKAPGEV